MCPRHPHDEELSHGDSSLCDRLDDLDKERYRHSIPSFPEEEEEEEEENHRWRFDVYEEDMDEMYSRDESHDVGSVGEFKKKFALKSDRIMRGKVKAIERESEVDEMCAKELKNTQEAVSGMGMTTAECKACPQCGMEMLSFGETLECPFCALEVIKEELGIAGMQFEQEVNNAKVKEEKKGREHHQKEKNEHGTIKSIDVGDLLAVSSSCSTLSASWIQHFIQDKEPMPQEAPRDNAEVAISAVINKLRDTQIAEQRSRPTEGTATAASQAPEKTPTATKNTSSCKEDDDQLTSMPEVSLDEKDARAAAFPDVGLTPMPEENQQEKEIKQPPSVTGSTQTPVNTVLKKLITGFLMQNKEKTTTQHNDDENNDDNNDDVEGYEINDDVSLPSVFDEHAEEEEEGEQIAADLEMERLLNQTLNEELFHGVKSINDDLQARVKSFAAIVFGTNKQGADDDDKSKEVNVTSTQGKDGNDDSNRCNESMAPKTESHSQQEVEQDSPSNMIPGSAEQDARPDDISPIENALFHDDMSAEEIFATLNEIEAVTKNILDLPVFHDNQDNQIMSREDEETNSRQEANCRSSTIDPPSVCSRYICSGDSREDPPIDKNGDVIISTGDELLTPQKEKVAVLSSKNDNIPEAQHENLSMPAPDSRDPPTTFSRKYQPRSEAINLDTIISPSAVPQFPRDPSEHGGSGELDSFSQEEDSNNLQSNQLGSNKQDIVDRVKKHIILNQGMSPQNKLARAEPADPVVTIDRFQKINSTNVCQDPLIRKYLKKSQYNGADTKSQRPDPMESDLRALSITESQSITLSPRVNKVTPLQAKDLYQRPDFLIKTVEEPESAREAMVRNRLLQLNSRCQELAAPSNTCPSPQINSVDHSKSNTQPMIQDQRFTFDSVDLQHQTKPASSTPLSTKESLSSLSPGAAARRQHYKKQLFAAEKKNRIQPQHNNDTGPCLSASALQRRKHYMEVLKEKMHMERQSLQIVSQE